MGRLGTAEEVADVIVFAASPRAHWINGRNIPVDGLEQPHAPLDRRPYYTASSLRTMVRRALGRLSTSELAWSRGHETMVSKLDAV
jgi:hypothetical protein